LSAYSAKRPYTSTSTSASVAIACRCFTQLIEPLKESTTQTALRTEPAVITSRGL
jgi:hypothetical protein